MASEFKLDLHFSGPVVHVWKQLCKAMLPVCNSFPFNFYSITGPASDELDVLISRVSDNIGLSWIVLARSLGFSDTDIDSIEYRNPRELKEQIYQFFSQWKRREGDNATTGMLFAALYDGELNELLKKLDKIDNVKKSEQSFCTVYCTIPETASPWDFTLPYTLCAFLILGRLPLAIEGKPPLNWGTPPHNFG